MFFGKLGYPELLLLAGLCLLIFGPRQIPKLAKSLGETVRSMRGVAKELHGDDDGDTAEMRR